MNYWNEKHEFSSFTFKPTIWQWVKLFFSPVYIASEIADGVLCIYKIERISGYIVCTDTIIPKTAKTGRGNDKRQTHPRNRTPIT